MRTNEQLIEALDNNHDVKMTPDEVSNLAREGIDVAHCVYCNTASFDLAINDYDIDGNQVCCECMNTKMEAWRIDGEKIVKTRKTMLKYANQGCEVEGIPSL